MIVRNISNMSEVKNSKKKLNTKTQNNSNNAESNKEQSFDNIFNTEISNISNKDQII